MSITSASAVLTISQATLFPTPVPISQFAVDDIYDFAPAQILEEQMGVDGTLTFGFVFTARRQNITLMADSPSNDFFDTIMLQQQAARIAYPLNGVIRLPALSRVFTMVNGGLRDYAVAPDAKRVLGPRRYTVAWNFVTPGPA